MKRSIKSLLATLVVSLSLAAPVLAGPWEDAEDTYIRKDYATAMRLMRPLAEQGQTNAQFSIGIMYAIGKGVRQDYVEAVKWFRKAAEQGDASAQNSLGSMYLNGYGVLQDFVEAHKWFNLAAARGNKHAEKNRVTVSIAMTHTQIAEAQRLAREWKPKK